MARVYIGKHKMALTEVTSYINIAKTSLRIDKHNMALNEVTSYTNIAKMSLHTK